VGVFCGGVLGETSPAVAAPTRVRGKRNEASERVPTAGGDPTTLLNRFAEELRRIPVFRAGRLSGEVEVARVWG